jgi:hypothetical protein
MAQNFEPFPTTPPSVSLARRRLAGIEDAESPTYDAAAVTLALMLFTALDRHQCHGSKQKGAKPAVTCTASRDFIQIGSPIMVALLTLERSTF